MWARLFQGIVAFAAAAFITMVVFTMGACVALGIRPPSQTSSASFTPLTPSGTAVAATPAPPPVVINETLVAIQALDGKIDARFNHFEQRLKRLEDGSRVYVAPPAPSPDPCDACCENGGVIPPHLTQ